MKLIEMFDSGEVPTLEGQYDDIYLRILGASDSSFEKESFLKAIEGVSWKDEVTGIHVAGSSRIDDCKFIAAFSNLRSLQLDGNNIRSLSGIGAAPQLEQLVIDVKRRNKPDLTELPSSSVTRVTIRDARRVDLEIVHKCDRILSLQIDKGDYDSLENVVGKGVEALTLVNSKIKFMEGLESTAEIKKLWIERCRNFAGFTKEINSVREVTISTCNNFSVSSIKNLPSVRVVHLLGYKKEVRLSCFSSLKHVQEIHLANARVSGESLKVENAPNLKKIWINPTKNELVEKISESNHGVIVSNGRCAFVNGVSTDVKRYYEG